VEHKKQLKIDIQTLKNEDVLNKYWEEINTKLTNNISEDTAGIEEHWSYLKTQILETANDILGLEPTQDRREWFDEGCKATKEERNKTYQEYLGRPTLQKQEIYKQKRRDANKLCWRKKRAVLNNHFLQMDKDFKKNNTSDAFICVKSFKEKVLKLASYSVRIQTEIC
jgi:recombinational DNA repair ATPase RecF